MPRTTSGSEPIDICVLDNDASALKETSEILSSAGLDVGPFVDPDTILTYAAMHQPAAAIINFGGSRAHRLEIAERLRAISPSTSVIISLKVHRSKAHKMLMGTEMVNLIKQLCVEPLEQEQSSLERSAFSREEEIDLDGCV